MSEFRVGMPGRHPLIAHHLLDHLGPANRLLIVLQRERSDLAGPMTFDAMLLENTCNLIRISDLAVVRNFAHATDQAAYGFGRRLAHFLAG